jgi:hypothetical protein
MLELQTRMTNVRWFIQFENFIFHCAWLAEFFNLKLVDPDFVGNNSEYAR